MNSGLVQHQALLSAAYVEPALSSLMNYVEQTISYFPANCYAGWDRFAEITFPHSGIGLRKSPQPGVDADGQERFHTSSPPYRFEFFLDHPLT
jgi:hypothetical protein